jgi:mannitol-1-/sugar-/sorbitol-6-phosphatase
LHLECEAILLDLDGVLVDSIGSIDAAAQHWAVQHSIDYESVRVHARARTDVEMISIVAPHLNPESESRRIRDIELEFASMVEAQPGSASFVSDLGLLTIPWAVVTSGQREVAMARLSSAGLPIPDVLVAASDTALGKPDPSPYLHAARLLGVTPSKCVVIEDTPTGAAAGLSAGMTVITVTNTHPKVELIDVSHCTISEFAEITPFRNGLRISGDDKHRIP